MRNTFLISRLSAFNFRNYAGGVILILLFMCSSVEQEKHVEYATLK